MSHEKGLVMSKSYLIENYLEIDNINMRYAWNKNSRDE